MLHKIHDQLESVFSKENAYFDEIAHCSHRPNDGCDCRKPNPGMLLRLASKNNIDLGSSYMVGDNSTDIAAGQAAGTYTVKIGTPDPLADINAGSLYEAVPMILEMRDRLQ